MYLQQGHCLQKVTPVKSLNNRRDKLILKKFQKIIVFTGRNVIITQANKIYVTYNNSIIIYACCIEHIFFQVYIHGRNHNTPGPKRSD